MNSNNTNNIIPLSPEEAQCFMDYPFVLDTSTEGTDKIVLYFSTVTNYSTDEWVVDDVRAFYKGLEITNLFDFEYLSKRIYERSPEVDDMFSQAWLNNEMSQVTEQFDDIPF